MRPRWSPRSSSAGAPPLAVAAAVVATALAWGLAVAPRLHAQEPDLITVARVFEAAWNAHDLTAVLACFASDAVVRERRGDVPPAVWDTRDPQVVRAYLEDSHDGDAYDTGGLDWAAGHRQIAAWAAARFAARHRFVTQQHRAVGDTVTWHYRELVDPFQRNPGLSPIEGTAEAVVRGGTITVLTLVQSPASVARRRVELAVWVAQAPAPHRGSPFGDGPRGQLRGPQSDGPAAEPTGSAWPLALGAFAVLAASTAALRRRRAPRR